MAKNRLSLQVTYSLIYGNPALLTPSFRQLYANIIFNYKINMRFSAAFDGITACNECYATRLDFHKITKEAEKVSEVVIYVPQSNEVPSDIYLMKNQDEADTYINIQNTLFQMFKQGKQKLIVFCHPADDSKATFEYPFFRLALQMRDRFPNAILTAKTSQLGEGGQKTDPISKAVLAALDKAQMHRSKYVFGLRKNKKQNLANVELSKADVVLKNCKCVFCQHPTKKAQVSHTIFEGEFPRVMLNVSEAEDYVAEKLARYAIPPAMSQRGMKPQSPVYRHAAGSSAIKLAAANERARRAPSSAEYTHDLAEVASLISHDLFLRSSNTFKQPKRALSEFTVAACSVNENYTRADQPIVHNPYDHGASNGRAATTWV